MNTKHTPGPWAVDPDDRPDMEWNNHIVTGDGRLTICFMAHDGDGLNIVSEANARLIAAAPDLLEALIHLEHNARKSRANMGLAIDVARAAIAKATIS